MSVVVVAYTSQALRGGGSCAIPQDSTKRVNYIKKSNLIFDQ